MDLSTLDYTYILIAALLVGFTKTSVGGVGILAVLLMALAFPGKASPGILLPMLLLADVFAVLYYRRDCQWKILLKIFPMTALGVILAYYIIDLIPIELFRLTLGWLILLMLALGFLMDYFQAKQGAGQPLNHQPPPANKNTAVLYSFGKNLLINMTGLAAGVTTMIANAAGPVFSVYLLRLGLKKAEFVGTRSWFFLVINVFKIPFSISLGLITPQTLTLNAMAIPVIIFGAYLGYIFLKKINLSAFKWLVRAAVLVAAIRLIIWH